MERRSRIMATIMKMAQPCIVAAVGDLVVCFGVVVVSLVEWD